MSASRPQKYASNGELWAVKFQQNGYGDGRAIAAEQVVALAGSLINAPVPDVALIDIGGSLIPSSIDMGSGSAPLSGLHHGSRWIMGYGDRQGFAYQAHNHTPFAALEILYTWLHCNGDHQFIYRATPPHDVLSVDHSCFFPGGPNWTTADLLNDCSGVRRDPVLSRLGLPPGAYTDPIARLGSVTLDQIADLASRPPKEWGITVEDRLAIAEFLLRRRDLVVAEYGGGP